MPDFQSLIKLLQNDNPNKRYEACEELRVSQQPLPQEAIDALKSITNDSDPDVADAAQRALALHTHVSNEPEFGQEQDKSSAVTITPKLEWGLWFLWILASVTAGGLAITYIFFGGYDLAHGVSASLGGIIGGIAVGFMPWHAQKRQISQVVWQRCIFISIALIVIALAIVAITNQWLFGIYISYWFIPSVLGSSIIGLITRGICQLYLISQVSWWRWVLAVISILIIGFVMLLFVAATSMV